METIKFEAHSKEIRRIYETLSSFKPILRDIDKTSNKLKCVFNLIKIHGEKKLPLNEKALSKYKKTLIKLIDLKNKFNSEFKESTFDEISNLIVDLRAKEIKINVEMEFLQIKKIWQISSFGFGENSYREMDSLNTQLNACLNNKDCLEHTIKKSYNKLADKLETTDQLTKVSSKWYLWITESANNSEANQ